MCTNKPKVIAIVQLVLVSLALILSIIALVGGVTDDYDTLKNTYWLGAMDVETPYYDYDLYSDLLWDVYFGWRSACQKRVGGVFAVCDDLEWDKEDAATAMGVLAALFSIGSVVLGAVKLCKPNKLVNIIGCVVAFLAIIFTIACFAMWADEFKLKYSDDLAHYGPGFGACVSSFGFQLIALVLGVVSLAAAKPAASPAAGAPEIAIA
ncbi:hypothetical protein EMIHUDRAFT_439244 [Emiliania huxleyi CCMP1516]|uniref:Uncharacterized protein n=2 Tax=Emiliania huxleyi TaxID=2903 RepID=A0A0D3HZ32_EMIH1|nr:hypothetical protein EMIHUDRAFT_439244 [Emiliania huxleyi CCMP1516]EOD04267.1 hypothetical protein EMIHUDRAFT_439244 [Emiliania huxleyi CCMP1516]|eukprot:XP_005756696.1 hypothetical protein EMIHUDRAFT_439244 [Emiliania huxleyi CCMP1516]